MVYGLLLEIASCRRGLEFDALSKTLCLQSRNGIYSKQIRAKCTALVFPYRVGDKIVAEKCRNKRPKAFWQSRGGCRCMGLSAEGFFREVDAASGPPAWFPQTNRAEECRRVVRSSGLYGVDDLRGEPVVVITEAWPWPHLAALPVRDSVSQGEIDKLSVEAAGYRSGTLGY